MHGSVPRLWLLLDSCSTVCLICDKSLLTNIHTVADGIKVHCNAGTIKLNQQGYLGDYPNPCWYHPQGIANIMSMHEVASVYQTTMDSQHANEISLHHNDGTQVPFTPSSKGLYKHAFESQDDVTTFWTDLLKVEREEHLMIETVADRADKYTARDIDLARAARRLQNIIMQPGSRKLMDKIISSLPNCPVTKDDVRRADDVWGPNLGSLKGKTVRRPLPHTHDNVAPVPTEILTTYPSLAMAIDIMFVNKIPFLVTYTRWLKFGTVKAIPNCHAGTIASGLKAAINLYTQHGFGIHAIFADPEFEALRPSFPALDTCGADDHIPEIEHYIRTIKDRTRSAYRMLPFDYIPRLMHVHLMKNSVFWLNSFPATDGISSIHSPRYIMTGKEVDYNKHCRIEFGSYVQTHEEHGNDMGDRTLGAICLGPTGNKKGTHWFMNLLSGDRITRT